MAADYSDLRALFINCTLKRSPEVSNTQGLADISIEIMRRQGVTVDVVRAIDHEIATGVWPDMTEHGWARDDWPAISEQVMAADILTPCSISATRSRRRPTRGGSARRAQGRRTSIRDPVVPRTTSRIATPRS
jgi:hypothetical protein